MKVHLLIVHLVVELKISLHEPLKAPGEKEQECVRYFGSQCGIGGNAVVHFKIEMIENYNHVGDNFERANNEFHRERDASIDPGHADGQAHHFGERPGSEAQFNWLIIVIYFTLNHHYVKFFAATAIL